MGLTAFDIGDVARLAQLAANPRDTTKEEIYLAVASLYRVEDVRLTERERQLMNEILQQLTKDVEMSIRIALAEKLADDPSAPYDLIVMLADDRIEVARPVILRSPLLDEKDMLHLALECGIGHQETLASRPNINERIAKALSDSPNESVLIALVRNATAKISPTVFENLAERSRSIETLREPLARREDMPPEIGMKMCAFVSETLKAFIINNYAVKLEKLQAAIVEAGESVSLRPTPPMGSRQDNARKLIEKLYVAGQIKAGFLLRVLQQGNIDLFEQGFARLLDFGIVEMRQTLYENGPETMALACRAVGIDRAVFQTVYTQSYKARALRPVLSPEDMEKVDAVFTTLTKTDAFQRISKNR